MWEYLRVLIEGQIVILINRMYELSIMHNQLKLIRHHTLIFIEIYAWSVYVRQIYVIIRYSSIHVHGNLSLHNL